MTNATVEVITSVQRRRRWSRAEKERLVAAAIEQLKFTIAKLRHERFGQSAEREQLEFQLADLEEDASQAETKAQMAVAAAQAARQKIEVRSFERRPPARRPLPEHLACGRPAAGSHPQDTPRLRHPRPAQPLGLILKTPRD